MNEERKIIEHSLFPTLVYECHHPDSERLNQNLIQVISNLRDIDKEGVYKSNINGWQSRDNLNELPQFESFTNWIKEISIAIIEKSQQSWHGNLVNMWANVNGKNCYNERHIHNLSILSGVYYVKIPPKNTSNIRFYDPRLVSDFLGYTMFNDTEVVPKEGQLLIFPGWLGHMVTPNGTDEDRISISFNFQ